MRMLSIGLMLTIVGSVQAQTDSTKTLEEAVIYTNKFREKLQNTAQQAIVLTARSIAKVNAGVTGDLLSESGQVFVQKSQQGGSSPVLRGFEASRVLLLVDGIRMNNAIYRAGHLQNAVTIDQNMLESVEVLFGPGSTLHGSDALGGVINFRTKQANLSSTNKLETSGNSFFRYRTVNHEITGHVDVNVGGKKWAWLQSYTVSKFDDLKMGGNYPAKYPNFGRRSQYIQTANGVDQIVTNSDDRIQKFSGYNQWDLTQKILLKSSDKLTHSFNVQLSNSTDIPRYDRLQDKKNFGGSIGTTLRYAEWYYGPQLRLLSAYQAQWSPTANREVSLQVHYQHVLESRQTREYLRYDRFDSRREKLNVWGFNLDTRTKQKNNEFTYGIDGQWNNLTSVADRTNLRTGDVTPLDTRYPNGTNHMLYLGAYGQHLRKSKSQKWILNDGIRLQLIQLRSSIADNSFFNFPFTEIQQDNLAVTGNIGLIYNPEPAFRAALNLSSGFRAPNIDDAARIFESSTTQRRLIVPNPDIQPEQTYNIDLNWIYRIEEKIRFEGAAFFTHYKNAITLAPYTLNGADSIDYNGVRSALYANQNARNGSLLGIQGRLVVQLGKRWSLDNTLTKTQGQYKTEAGRIPLDHIPPVFGRSSIAYQGKRFSTEAYLLFNGWKKLADYNLDGEDNLQYATPDGMPGWTTINLRLQVNVSKTIQLQGSLENLTDRNYRVFASGLSAPGRSWMISVRAKF